MLDKKELTDEELMILEEAVKLPEEPEQFEIKDVNKEN